MPGCSRSSEEEQDLVTGPSAGREGKWEGETSEGNI